MKKILIILLCLIALSGCDQKQESGAATHLDAIKEKGYITIGSEGMWSPWTYIDENGELLGYDVEVGKAIAEKLGVEANCVTNEFDGLLMGLESGQFDMVINGIDITEERKKKFDFSEPYAYSEVVLIVAKDNEDIKTLDDLKGKKTANSAGSSYEALAESYGASNQAIDTFTETIYMIEQGRADATINSKETYEDYLSKLGEGEEASTKVVLEVNALDTAIPFVKGDYDASFLEAVNQAIDELKNDGTLEKLSIKYFGKDISSK